MRINLTLPAPLAKRLKARVDATGLRPTVILQHLVSEHLPEVEATPARKPRRRAVARKSNPTLRAKDRALIDLWRSLCVPAGCPDITTDDDGNPGRTLGASIAAAVDREGDARDWRALFERVAESRFLTGKKTEFRASLTWCIGPKNIGKIDAGTYDAGRAPQGYRNTSTTTDFDY